MPDAKISKTFLSLRSVAAIVSVLAMITFAKRTVAQSQIIPDRTLLNNSRVTIKNNLWLIEGGTQSGGNLFHSFQQFSVPTGSTVYFNNTVNIQNIIGRVTGGSVSKIDGLIQANGAANVFLINPAGIVFGSGASVNIGGSFFATTANSLIFSDGTQFSSKGSSSPLLTLSIPIGLQFEDNPGSILVQGEGQGIRTTSKLIDTTVGLHVQPNQTLALIGGNVALEGGTLKTPGGRIELGSVAGSGFVKLLKIDKGWSLDYRNIQNFGNIELSSKAAVDASGKGSGDIQVIGRQILLRDGSQIENSTLEAEAGGTLVVMGSELVLLSGVSAQRGLTTIGTLVYPGARGAGGNVQIDAGRLVVQDGAQISSSTFGKGVGGNLTVWSPNLVEVGGASTDGLVESGLFTSTHPGTSGPGGNLTIKTGQLNVRDGGQISSGTSGAGSAGSLVVQARDSIIVSGVSVVKRTNKAYPSTIGASTEPGSTGSSGNLILDTKQLVVTKGAVISTASFGKGASGILSIRADSVELSDPSSSATFTVSGLSSRSGGDQKAGDVIIDAKQLSVNNGAQISVKNSGTGNGGLIQINSNSIKLNNRGSINASTSAGEGGNISLYSSDLRLKDSSITASAGNRGNGGNEIIDTETLEILGNSSITANAFLGRGGNIKINAQGFFLSPESKITASSEKGVDGSVIINTSESKTKAITHFPDAVNPPNTQAICPKDSDESTTGQLLNTSGSSILQEPHDLLANTPGWHNSTRNLNIENSVKPVHKFVEAQGWRDNGDGTVRFVAEPDEVVPYGSLSSSPCQPSENL
jgi:filamentous hemagglutinin family protein